MVYKYTISYAPTGRARCKGCGKIITRGTLRISRDSGPIAQFNDHSIVNHFHLKHAFDTMQRGLCTSKVVLARQDLHGLKSLKHQDRIKVERQITTFSRKRKSRCTMHKASRKRKSTSRRKSMTATRQRRSLSVQLKSFKQLNRGN